VGGKASQFILLSLALSHQGGGNHKERGNMRDYFPKMATEQVNEPGRPPML
jgi:hypothetical protein